MPILFYPFCVYYSVVAVWPSERRELFKTFSCCNLTRSIRAKLPSFGISKNCSVEILKISVPCPCQFWKDEFEPACGKNPSNCGRLSKKGIEELIITFEAGVVRDILEGVFAEDQGLSY